MSRGLKINNPGNIRKSKSVWQGEIVPSSDPELKQFKKIADGYRAMFVLLYTYFKKYGLNTIEKIITRWAPPIENDTAAYISKVSSSTEIPEDKILTYNETDMKKLAAAMSAVEQGVPAKINDVNAGWDLLKKKL